MFQAVVLLLSLGCYLLMGYVVEKENMTFLLLMYFGLFGGYFFLLDSTKVIYKEKWIIAASITFRAVLLFNIPILSDDFYRFVWDGHLTAFGINPYLHLPTALVGMD